MANLVLCLIGCSLGLAVARAESPAPRRAYWCASLLRAADHRPGEAFGIGEAVGRPRDAVARALVTAADRAWWVLERVRPRPREVDLRTVNVDTLEPAQTRRGEMRALVARLDGLRKDLRRLPKVRIPLRRVIRGEDDIRSYLAAQERVAHNLEGLHPRFVPRDVPARPSVRWHNLINSTVAVLTIATWSASTILTFDYGRPNGYVYAAINLALMTLAYPGARDAGRDVVAQVKHAWRVHVTERGADVAPDLADREVDLNTQILRVLRAPNHLVARTVIYRGYSVDLALPPGRGPTPLDPTSVAFATLTHENRPLPWRHRRVLVDQVFQFEEATRRPTLTVVVRDRG